MVPLQALAAAAEVDEAAEAVERLAAQGPPGGKLRPASSTSTRSPASASTMAATDPLTPAPTTTASQGISLPAVGDGAADIGRRTGPGIMQERLMADRFPGQRRQVKGAISPWAAF